MVYGYCRISTPQQKIERQVENILRAYPDAVIIKEAYSGRRMVRPEWMKIYRKFQPDDVIVFDEVSRMSRNADEGAEVYQELFERGIELRFLKDLASLAIPPPYEF